MPYIFCRVYFLNMKVTANTTILYFVSPDVTNVEVTITNKQSKKITYQSTLTVTQESYYNTISDTSFDFAKDQTYIIDIEESGLTIYRATIYSDVTDNYSVSNKINTQDEYITIK